MGVVGNRTRRRVQGGNLNRYGSIDIVGCEDVVDLSGPCGYDLPNLGLAHPGALDPLGRVGARTKQQHVALADKAFGAGLVEDHPTVGEARHSERQTCRNVCLDHARDDVHRGSLGGDHQVDSDGSCHLGETADGVFDITCGHHHQVGQLVDDDQDEGQPLVGQRFAVVVDHPQWCLQLAAVVGGVVAGNVAEPAV